MWLKDITKNIFKKASKSRDITSFRCPCVQLFKHLGSNYTSDWSFQAPSRDSHWRMYSILLRLHTPPYLPSFILSTTLLKTIAQENSLNAHSRIQVWVIVSQTKIILFWVINCTLHKTLHFIVCQFLKYKVKRANLNMILKPSQE